MLTIFGLFVVATVLSYMFILPSGVFFKKQPLGWKRCLFLRTIFVFTVAVSIWDGIYLAIQIGKKFPTHLVKTMEVEYISDYDSTDVFVRESYEPRFVNGKHLLIGIPSVNGIYGVRYKIKKKEN